MEDHHRQQRQVAPRCPDEQILGHSSCSEGDRPLLHLIALHPYSTVWQPRPSPPPMAQLLRHKQYKDMLCCETKEHTGTTLLVSGEMHMKVHTTVLSEHPIRIVRSRLQHGGICSHIPRTASASRDYSSSHLHCLLALSHCRTVTSATAPSERLSFFSFLNDFARTATVDPSAISITAAHESSPATVPALPTASQGKCMGQNHKQVSKWRRCMCLSIFMSVIRVFELKQVPVVPIGLTAALLLACHFHRGRNIFDCLCSFSAQNCFI